MKLKIDYFKKNLFLLVIFQAFAFLSVGQTVFNRQYYFDTLGTGSARANTVIQTSDNGFLMAGTTKNALIMYIIKTNNQGDTLWTIVKDLGTGGGDLLYTAIETSDNCYVVGGATRDMSVPNSDAFIMKIGAVGNILWTRVFNAVTTNSERCYNIKQTSDGGFIFCGIRYNPTGTECDVYLVKTDNLGFLQWEKTFGGADYDFGNSIGLTSDGGYIIFGSTYSFGAGIYNMYLVKADSVGNLIWQKTYGGSMKDYGTSMTISNDGNYLLSGGIQTAPSSFHGYVLKTDTSGVVMWQKQYGNGLSYNEFTSVKETPSGNIIASGTYENNSGIRIHPVGWLFKLDAAGDSIFSKNYSFMQMILQTITFMEWI